jgi:glycosyltransferase involved in cell wall biosynthesis
MKINILRLITSVYSGGTQRGLLLYSKFYNSQIFNLHIISLRSGNSKREFKKVLGKNFTSLDLKRRISLKGIIKLIKYVKKNKIHIVSTHLFEADIYGFFIKLFCPYITLFAGRHAQNKFRERFFFRILIFLITIPVKKVICISKALKQFTRKYELVPRSKLTHVYNGINLDLFYSEDKSELRKKFIKNNENDVFLIGIIGRLIKRKGHSYLIKTIHKLILDGISNIKVLVVGEGEYLDNLVKLRNRLNLKNHIKFLGFKKNVRDFYNILDLLCVPSDFEGFGYVIIEAMACQTLVLSSDIPGPNEIISHGINGLLFKKGDINDLAEKIKLVMTNSFNIEKIKKFALKRVENVFEISKMVKNYEKIYLNNYYS